MHRTSTIIKGLVALGVLTAVVVGLPVALWAVGGSPLPTTMPNPGGWWQVLTSRDDGTLLLGVLRVAAWIGWAMFTASVVADLAARARHVRVPRLGPQQAVASQLVAAVAALTLLAPTVAAAAPVNTAPSTAGTSASAPRSTVPAQQPAERAAQRPADTSAPRSWHKHRVVGGDTLWDIAAQELGDPFAWPKIYAASTRLVQPNGQRLHDPDLILPGWTLRVPAPVDTPTQEPVEEPAARDTSGPSQAPRAPAGASDDSTPELMTPLGGRGARSAGAPPPAVVPQVMTPLSLPSARISTPLSTSSPAAAGDDEEVTAHDWRARIRAAVPELQ